MIPETLEGWDLRAILSLLAQGVFESDRFDFKESLPDPRNEPEKLGLRKTCAALANSAGGFLVFGVKDQKDLPHEQRVAGFEATFDLPERFGNFPAQCEPSVSWIFKNPPVVLPNGRCVHVVQVPKGRSGPHAVPDGGRLLFFKRTSKGNEHMSYHELRSMFVDGARRHSDLALLSTEIQRIGELAREINLTAYHRKVQDVILARYSVAVVEQAAHRLFDEVSANPPLVQALNELRAACSEADRLADRVRQFEGMTQVDHFLSKASQYAQRIMHTTAACTRHLEKVVQ